MLVSKDPLATKSPYGWKSMLLMLDLWPDRVRRTRKKNAIKIELKKLNTNGAIIIPVHCYKLQKDVLGFFAKVLHLNYSRFLKSIECSHF